MMDEFLDISADTSEFDIEENDSFHSEFHIDENDSSDSPPSGSKEEYSPEKMPILTRPKRSVMNRKRTYDFGSDSSEYDDDVRDKDFVANSEDSESDDDTGSCRNKNEDSSHEISDRDEQAVSAHGSEQGVTFIDEQESEITSGVINEDENMGQEESNNLTQDNSESSDSSMEMNIDIITKLFVKKLKSILYHRDRLRN